MKNIEIGIIGNGNHFKKNIKPVIIKLNVFKKENILTKKNNKEFFYKKFDIIYISNQTQFHGKTIIKCLENNFNVMCEKPLFLNKKELKKIVDLANKKKLLVFECFMYRFHKAFDFIKKKIKNKKINFVYSAFKIPSLKQKNFRYQKKQGGFYWDTATYPISLDTLLFNEKKIKNKKNILVKKNLTQGCIIQSKGNLTKIYKWGEGQKYENYIEILCDDVSFHIKKFYSKNINEKIKVEIYKKNSLTSEKFFYDDHFKNMFIYVIQNYRSKEIRKIELKNIIFHNDRMLKFEK